MIQIVSGLEISLAKQYFDDWLVSIKQHDCSSSRTEIKQITASTWRACQLLESVISSEECQIASFFWKILSTPNWKLITKKFFE